MNPGWGERVGVWMCAGVVVAQVVEQIFDSFYQAMAKIKFDSRPFRKSPWHHDDYSACT